MVAGLPGTSGTALRFNPRTKLMRLHTAGELSTILVMAPVRGRPLHRTRVTPEQEPELFALLVRLAAREGAVTLELDEALRQRLAELGVLTPQDSIAPPVPFVCSALAASTADLPESPRTPDRLLVNPQLRERGDRHPLHEILAPHPGIAPPRTVFPVPPFRADATFVEVEVPDACSPLTLTLTAEERLLFRQLTPGAAAPADLAPEHAAALAAADVLVDPEAISRRRAAWQSALSTAGEQLRSSGYAVVRGLIHPLELAALRRYYSELIAQGYVPFGDGQVDLRYFAHNEPMALCLHHRLTELVSALAGEPMKPSYTFFASYRPGAVLTPHRDREQCQLSISVQLDRTGPPTQELAPWPLCLGEPGGATAIHLGLGDGLFYRGGDLTHFRDELPAGQTSTSVFFHYVPAAFVGSLD